GTIARVEVVNFMCHKYLKVDLGPKINFVIGHNGSGKSAILTAITLALGANANSTNRGRNLGSFIKEGMSAANITIHLTNGGDRPYKPNLYPGIIVIERRLNLEGPSPYKLKNSSGKIISHKKEDLIAILDHFSILVNNPLTMLTQDMARKFLSDSTAEDKYRLFMNGTQLSNMQIDFETVRQSLDTAKTTLDRKKEGLPGLQEKANEAQRRYEDLKEARDITTHIDELNNELVWSQIILKEKVAEKYKHDVAVAERNLENMQEQYETQKSKIDDVVKKIEAVNQEWDHHRNDELMDINELIKSTRTAKARQETNLKVQTDKLEASTRVKRDEILEEINQAKEIIETKRKQAKEFRIQYDEFDEQSKAVKEKRGHVIDESKETRDLIDQCTKKIYDLNAQQQNRMKAYGSNMPHVLDAIDREKRWRMRKPAGPFGSTMKLLQPQFANTLESFFKKSLNSFVVECFHDKHLLFNILKRAKLENTTIYVSEYDAFDYSTGEPDPQYMTILRAIKFENDWIKRQLIVHQYIEKALLFEDRVEADNVMLTHPRNAKMCFTSGGHKVGGSVGMKTETLDPWSGLPRFMTDIGSQIRKYQQDKESLQEKYFENEKKLRDLTTENIELEKKRNASRHRENEIEAEIRKFYGYIENKEDNLKEDDPVDLSLFEEEIKECDEKLLQYVNQFKDIKAQRVALLDEMKHILDKTSLIEKKEAERENISHEYRTRVAKLHELKTKLADKLEQFYSQKQSLKSRLESRKTMLGEAEQLVRTWIAECQEDYPDRVDTEREPHEIEMEIKRLQGIASRIEDEAGITLEEVEELTMTTVLAWEQAMTISREMEALSAALREMLEKRIRRWENYRAYMVLAAKHYFSYYLHLRGDEGVLRFNHQTKRLDIRVSTGDQYRKGSRQKDSRSLSGGEKSFSQISLLLSLWQSISSPLICLDEFDVFMDAVNRKQTMSMIVSMMFIYNKTLFNPPY
ncbi:uncharacterized protein EV154DRAFT_422057, partial [Mucor mucedo]|uniref:uncharacterized protein n=1 Tax=Mucor mucedo TaxID=29922 RepID=UPI00221E839F